MARTAGFDDDLPAVMIARTKGQRCERQPADSVRRPTFQEFTLLAPTDIWLASAARSTALICRQA